MMGLELPADLEPYVESYDQLHSEGAYALELQRPVNLEEVWHRHNETKPPYWDQLQRADRVLYVGASGDLLSRLEDHRDNDDPERDTKRAPVLTRVCDVVGLHTAWRADSAAEAFEVLEPRMARWLQRTMPGAYVHSR